MKKKMRGGPPKTSREQPKAPPNRLATLADIWPKESSQRPEVGKTAAPKKAPPEAVPPRTAEPQPALLRQEQKPKPPEAPRPVRPAPTSASASQTRPSEQAAPRLSGQATRQQAPTARRLGYEAIISRRLDEKFTRPIRVNLGVDLGTSFTKVVWRAEGTSRPVCFGGRRKEIEDYLVPTIVAFDGSSMVCGAEPEALRKSSLEHRVSNFKMCLACVKEGDGGCSLSTCTLSRWGHVTSCADLAGREVDVIAAFFLASLVSKARRIIRAALVAKGVADPKIEWSANLAVPEKFMNQSTILDGFEKVLRTAWLMADVLDEVPSVRELDDLIDCYSCAEEIAAGQSLNCFVYPEVGAQIACVTLPRTARDGLYAFVDVGAGTVDASVFRLHTPSDEEPRLHTYAADVAKAGAAHIETVAARNLAREAGGWFKGMKEGEAGADLEACSATEILKPFLRDAVEEVSGSAESELRRVLSGAYRKEPVADRWQDLQLVIGGGGAKIPDYREAARRAFKGYKLATNLQEQELPVPGDFEPGGVRPSDFHRLAVAYGLSHRIIDLHEVALPDEVKPLRSINARSRRDPDDK